MDTEKMFNKALRALRGPSRAGRALGGRWVLVPPSADYPQSGPSQPQRRLAADRRRRNLTWLAGFIVVTFVLGLIRPLRFLLFANIVADGLLIAYLLAVLWFAARPSPSRQRMEVDQKRPPEVAGGRF